MDTVLIWKTKNGVDDGSLVLDKSLFNNFIKINNKEEIFGNENCEAWLKEFIEFWKTSKVDLYREFDESYQNLFNDLMKSGISEIYFKKY